MYRVLIVDDEAPDRNIVRILLERQYGNTFQISEAANGLQALEIAKNEQVDLLFLDIDMPGLSGLNVIRELNGSTYIIVLTAYSFFNYAQEALKYGVKNYLLKPPIRKELYEAVDKFLAEQKEVPLDVIPQRTMLFRELATQILFYGDQEKISSYYKLLKLNSPQISLSVFFPQQQLSPRQITEAEELLLTSAVPYAVLVFQENLVILFFWNSDPQYHAVQDILEKLQVFLKGTIAQEPHLTGYAEVSQAFIRLCERDISPHVILKNPDFSIHLENEIRNGDFSAAFHSVQTEYALLDYYSNSNEIKLNLISVLSICAKNLIVPFDQQVLYKRLSYLLGASSKEELMQMAAEFLRWIIGEVQNTSYTRSGAVQQAMNLIAQDCSKNWTIEGLATILHISPYYLSHLFKEVTGSSFVNYLTEYRLSQAIKLMQRSELSLSQIGEMVGYTDPNYFSRVFKKKRGISARNFRKQLKRKQRSITEDPIKSDKESKP